MRLPDEQDEGRYSTSVIYTTVFVSALILIILACVLVSNSKKPSRNHFQNQGTALSATTEPEENKEQEDNLIAADGQKDIETLYKENKLRAEDLDFWDMYDTTEAEPEPSPTAEPTPSPSHEPTEEELAQDGRHVQVSYKDGTTKWIEIEEDLPTCAYDFTKMKATNGKMVYYEGNKKISRLGIMLSAENGEVDFDVLKEEGIDFVMLKIGARGYETGLLTLDEAFAENAGKATEAGIKIGGWFSSQAVTEEEAKEEAEFVANQLIPYDITYPIAYRMDSITYDTARTDILDEEKKTQMAEVFLTEIEKAGHQGILYGSKDWLLTEVIFTRLLTKWEVWLTEDKPVPDYPYRFQMWEYAQGESGSGITGDISYTISFVDYAQR